MYHVVSSIGGVVKHHDLPKGRGTKHCPTDVERYAKECFSHSRCDWVAVSDTHGIIGYVSHTGQTYFNKEV